MDIVIAGVGESAYGKETGRTSLQLHYDAARAALADCGLGFSDVDGLFSCAAGTGLHGAVLSEYLGVRPRYFDSTMLGGSTWETFVEHAVGALRAGQCDVALLVYGSAPRTQFRSGLGPGIRDVPAGTSQHIAPFGLTTASAYAMAAHRHMARFGTTSEQLAEVAVSARANAARNPKAMYREPITVADVLASPMVADPLHVLDCCVISDGGGAVVLTRADRARDLRSAPVAVLGAATAVTHDSVIQMDDLAVHAAASASGRAAFTQAGVGPGDIDVLQIYDSFTITVVMTLEALGFCGPGEGGAFVEGGRLAYDGALPTNNDGGGLSSNHPGMRGVFLLIEAVRQLRGEAGPWQVEPRPRLALCHGTGGQLSACGTVILALGD